ncbi:MAG: TRAP transporter large permease [Spirochaetales bacterium]|nr:TRAP transporter large permease [Spirochaetales bacterium]
MLTLLLFVVLLVLILLDVPVAVSMAVTSFIFVIALGLDSTFTSIIQRMYKGTIGETLLAVPFFILAGNLMNTSGITDRIFNFAKALVGHVPGGLGQVSVVSSMIFSGMSGSAVADAAGFGQIQHKAMVDNGYKPAVSASIVAAASTIGPVIPPSIPFVLFGALASVSVPSLFMAGFVPGILMGLILMITILIMAKPRNFPRFARPKLSVVGKSFLDAILPLLAPVIIIGGILTGFFTPTEASLVVCVYAILLGFLYRDLKVTHLPGILWTSIKQSVGLLFIMAAANAFGWLTIYQEIPDQMVTTLTNMSATSGGVMAIIIAVVLVLGLFLEGNAIFLITIPIFKIVAVNFGIDLVHLGVIMTLLIMVGNLTPPVGMCLFAVSSFSKIPIMKLAKETWPYILGIFIVTIIMAYIPKIVTFMPDLMNNIAK